MKKKRARNFKYSRQLNPEPPEQETAVLVTRPEYFILDYLYPRTLMRLMTK
jgi:hypothetical protein